MKFNLMRYSSAIIGVIFMVNLFGCSDIKFEKYSSKDPLLNASMDYISDWKYEESRGSYNSYVQVIFLPFKKRKMSPHAIIVLTEKDSSKMEFSPLNLDNVVNDFLDRRMQFKEAKVLAKSKIRLLNAEATLIELTYLSLENMLEVNSKLIPFKERVIIFEKDKKFYFLRYMNSLSEFDKFSEAFTHIIKTLRFKDNK